MPFWALWPLVVLGALLPLGMIGRLGTWAVKVMCERRVGRSLRPRPRAAYLAMALGWALAGGACALLAWLAGASSATPGAAGEDQIAAALAWAALISACAALMMLCRAPTAGGPAAIGRRRGQLLR